MFEKHIGNNRFVNWCKQNENESRLSIWRLNVCMVTFFKPQHDPSKHHGSISLSIFFYFLNEREWKKRKKFRTKQTFLLISIRQSVTICVYCPLFWCCKRVGRCVCVSLNRYVKQSKDGICNIFYCEITKTFLFSVIQCDANVDVLTHPQIPFGINDIAENAFVAHYINASIKFYLFRISIVSDDDEEVVECASCFQRKRESLILTKPSLYLSTFFYHVNHVWFRRIFLSDESISIHMICN